jgi:adenylate kinase family enzyme
VVECGGLENRYPLIADRGFESLSLLQITFRLLIILTNYSNGATLMKKSIFWYLAYALVSYKIVDISLHFFNTQTINYQIPAGKIMKKIVIFGMPGAGKSTWSLKLSQQANIPVYHIDQFFFTENWKKRPTEDFIKLKQEIMKKDSWILDGNGLKTLELRYKEANTAILFAYPRWICYWRIVKRLIIKDPAIKDRAPGCKEAVRWELIKYMWDFNQRAIALSNQLKILHPHVTFYTVHSDREAQELLKLLCKK